MIHGHTESPHLSPFPTSHSSTFSSPPLLLPFPSRLPPIPPPFCRRRGLNNNLLEFPARFYYGALAYRSRHPLITDPLLDDQLAMSKRSLSMHRSQLSHTPMPPKSSVPGVLNVPASIRNTDSSAKQAQHPRRRPNPTASRSNQPQQPLPHQRHRRARSQSQPPATTATATSPVGVSSPNPIHSPVTLAPSELPQLPLAENDNADAPLPAILSQPSGRIARARAQKHQRRQPPAASSQTGNNDSPQQGVAQQDSGSSTAKARASRRNAARPKSTLR